MRELYYTWTNETDLHCAFFEEGTQPVNSQLIELPYIQKPILSNGAVIESITPEEIESDLVVEYTERIKNAFTSLRRRALGSSIGKTGSWEYLYEQSQQYKDKYNVAKGTYINTVVSQMIADEANDFGIDAPTMNALIIQMYEAGEIAYYQFTAMIERARTKAITLMDNSELTRALEVIELMENVPEVLTMQDAENLSITLIAI